MQFRSPWGVVSKPPKKELSPQVWVKVHQVAQKPAPVPISTKGVRDFAPPDKLMLEPDIQEVGPPAGSRPPRSVCPATTCGICGQEIQHLKIRRNPGGDEKYLREDYAVTKVWFQQICSTFQIKPQIDCFTDGPGNAMCDKFYTKDDDSLQQEWPEDQVRWVNPPWSKWAQAAIKVTTTPGLSVCVCPDWRRSWHQMLKDAAEASMTIPKGSLLFEVDGKPCAGTRWDTCVYLVRGCMPKANYEPRWSGGQRRRWRRQATRAFWAAK